MELGPSSVAAWAGVELREPLTGGARNQVVRAERGSERLVVRESGRSVAVLAAVHELTAGWPQRPGFASSRQLLTGDHGGDVRLDAMPVEAVEAVRAAWRPVITGAECVNHGDVGGGNILVTEAGIALLDWDESRVDVPWFDFAFLPADVEADVPVDAEALRTAGVAWEAATCWMAEPDYAARRLAELRTRIAVKPQDMGTDTSNL